MNLFFFPHLKCKSVHFASATRITPPTIYSDLIETLLMLNPWSEDEDMHEHERGRQISFFYLRTFQFVNISESMSGYFVSTTPPVILSHD